MGWNGMGWEGRRVAGWGGKGGRPLVLFDEIRLWFAGGKCSFGDSTRDPTAQPVGPSCFVTDMKDRSIRQEISFLCGRGVAVA